MGDGRDVGHGTRHDEQPRMVQQPLRERQVLQIQIGQAMTEIEQLRRNTEKAYNAALRAMIDLVNAITEERNYYRELCNKKEG